jgi:type III pantothenate kinase
MSVGEVVLCIDVGNSHTVIGVWLGEEVVDSWRLTTNQWSTSDEMYISLKSLLESGSIKFNMISNIGLASVIPAMERPWVKGIFKLCKKPIQVVSHTNALDLKINYEPVDSLGVDRICNVLALKDMGVKSGIVVDLGTATTFDVLKDGEFAGGVIVPGMRASLEYLTEKASRLPRVSLDWTDNVLAQSTGDSLRSGILYGFLGQLRYLVEQIKSETDGSDMKVYGTGGWATLLGQKKTPIDFYDPNFTLRGIRAVALRGNQPQES